MNFWKIMHISMRLTLTTLYCWRFLSLLYVHLLRHSGCTYSLNHVIDPATSFSLYIESYLLSYNRTRFLHYTKQVCLWHSNEGSLIEMRLSTEFGQQHQTFWNITKCLSHRRAGGRVLVIFIATFNLTLQEWWLASYMTNPWEHISVIIYEDGTAVKRSIGISVMD